jgi:hypothetical protein
VDGFSLALPQKSQLTGLDEVARLIAAERRDVYSDVTNSPSSAKSEMLSISLFAEKEIGPGGFL